MNNIQRKTKIQTGRIRRGVGISVSMRGASVGADGNGFDYSRALIEVEEDGSVHVNIGLVDLGQGLRTCQGMMAADMMGVTFDRITMGETDTSRSPSTGACIASRGTFVGGAAIKSACDRIHAIIAQALQIHYGKSVSDIQFSNNRVTFGDVDIPFEEAIHICYGLGMTPMAAGDNRVPVLNWDGHFGEPFYTYTYSCNAAEVEVDLDTGSVYLVKMVGSHDMGRAINPTMAEGQIYGGHGHGPGYGGNGGSGPQSQDLCHQEPEPGKLPAAHRYGSGGDRSHYRRPSRSSLCIRGRSLGEPATENGAAAIACAINHALGKPGCIHQLPADLDRVFFAANPPAGKEGR